MVQPPTVLERALDAPDQLVPVRQAGQRVEIGQMANLVFRVAAIGHVLHDAGVAGHGTVLAELGLGLDVDDADAAVRQVHRHVGGQHRTVFDDFTQHHQQPGAVVRREHAQHCPKTQPLVRAPAEDAQALDRQQRTAVAEFPVEAAHARQVLRARQLGLAALEFDARARRAQQMAHASGQQPPLVRLDEKIGGANLVSARDRGIVLQAGQHQHRQRFTARQATQFLTGLKSVEPGHQSVEHHHVGQPVGQQLQGALAAAGFRDEKAAVAQGDRRQQQIHLVIVNQQHAVLTRKIIVWRQDLRAHSAGSSSCWMALRTTLLSSAIVAIRSSRCWV